ncbi:MAG: DUF3368 domain-containing protein [Terriglobia bacterium]
MEQIFRRVLIPHAVEQELTDPCTPEAVRQWMAQRPAWLEARSSRPPNSELARRLDQGEAEAIQLAIDLRADFLLIDELRGRNIATERGLVVIGVLGILLESHRQRRIKDRWRCWPNSAPIDSTFRAAWFVSLKNRSDLRP